MLKQGRGLQVHHIRSYNFEGTGHTPAYASESAYSVHNIARTRTGAEAERQKYIELLQLPEWHK
jgi:hypothetical protein